MRQLNIIKQSTALTAGLISGMLLVCLTSVVAPAHAAPVYETEYSNEQPLMVIRFNQHYVMYERPLYNTISQALQVKPSAMFDIVSVTPRAPNPADQSRFAQITQQNTQKVLSTLNEIGLPQSRINLTQATDNVESSEVRIFVH